MTTNTMACTTPVPAVSCKSRNPPALYAMNLALAQQSAGSDTAHTTHSATKMNMSLRETPQSGLLAARAKMDGGAALNWKY